MIQTLTKQETEKVKEYADWLREGKDKLDFRKNEFANDGENFWVQIFNKELGIEINKRKVARVKFTGLGNLTEQGYFEYFKPIAESYHRKWKLKEICGDLFECQKKE